MSAVALAKADDIGGIVVTLQLSLNNKQSQVFGEMVKLGLYGGTVEEVAIRILDEHLADFVSLHPTEPEPRDEIPMQWNDLR